MQTGGLIRFAFSYLAKTWAVLSGIRYKDWLEPAGQWRQRLEFIFGTRLY